MKGYTVVVLFCLLVASFFTSVHTYKSTERRVSEDMAQALEQTIAEQQSDVISQDTVRIFNSHLQLTDLRGRATTDKWHLKVNVRLLPLSRFPTSGQVECYG